MRENYTGWLRIFYPGRGESMGTSIGWMILLQIALIALNAVFACAEIAIISVNDAKLERMAADGNKKAARLVQLTGQPARFLATIQVAITLSGFLGSAFAAENFSDVLVKGLIGLGVGIPRATLDTIAVVLITLVLSYFTLVFGELIPKRIAMRRPEQLALGLSGAIGGIAAALRPVVWLLTASTNGILRLLGIDPDRRDDEVSEEEICMMVDAGNEQGSIDSQEKEFIQNVFRFDDLTAGMIATHRTDVDLLYMEDSMADWARTIHDTRRTRYPVCRGSADAIIGILNAKDYYRLEDKSRESILASAVKPAFFVPEDIGADVLFGNMKRRRSSLAVVLDEYGGMVGIVTMNDLIAQLVGEIGDESDDAADHGESIERLDESTWLVRGNAELDAIERACGQHFGSDAYETFSGLIFNAMGMVPDDGPQRIELEIGGMLICVNSVKEHQVSEAILKLKQE